MVNNRLQTTITFIRTHKAIIGLCAVLVVILIALILRYLTPPRSQLSSIKSPPTQTLKQVDFQGAQVILPASLPHFPEQLPVTSVSQKAISAADLASRFHITSQNNQGNWVTSDGKTSVVTDPYSGRIGYNNQHYAGDFDAALITTINKEEAIQAAQDFVSKELGLNDYSPNLNALTYLSKSEEYASVDPSRSNLLHVPFSLQAEGLPIFSDIDLNYPVIVGVDSTNTVTSLIVSPNLITGVKQTTEVTTLPLSELPNQILSNNVNLIGAASDFPDGFNIKNITKLEITAITLDYRLNSQTSQIIPYYHLKATATNLDNHPSQLDLITPAVNTTK